MKLGHRLSAAREQEFTKLSIGAELSLQAIYKYVWFSTKTSDLVVVFKIAESAWFMHGEALIPSSQL